jgi:hypothetical protein
VLLPRAASKAGPEVELVEVEAVRLEMELAAEVVEEVEAVAAVAAEGVLALPAVPRERGPRHPPHRY